MEFSAGGTLDWESAPSCPPPKKKKKNGGWIRQCAHSGQYQALHDFNPVMSLTSNSSGSMFRETDEAVTARRSSFLTAQPVHSTGPYKWLIYISADVIRHNEFSE